MLRVPVDIQIAVISLLEPYDLLHVAGVCKHLRVLALSLLWGTVDAKNRCARRMLKGMLRDEPQSADHALAGHFSHIVMARSHLS